MTANMAVEPTRVPPHASGGPDPWVRGERCDPMVKYPIGRMKVRCGCCIVPEDGWKAWIIFGLAAFPSAIFATSVPLEDEWWWMGVVTAVLLLTTSVSLLLAVAIDPGIVPPASLTGERIADATTASVPVGNTTYVSQTCRTCGVLRPPRSGHCIRCDTCVGEYDHHCGVLGSCVGARTFRFFAGFLFSATVLCLWVAGASISVMARVNWDAEGETHRGRWRIGAAIFCTLYAVVIGCFTVPHSFIYLQLSCTNATQKDWFGWRGQDLSKATRRGTCGCHDCCCRLFGPMQPSQLPLHVLKMPHSPGVRALPV